MSHLIINMKKTSKSPENVEVTPNKKKLKQARLPFMLLSDVSPKAETPPSRKRKLSVPAAVPATKVGKLSKENSITEELLVISDEDSKGLPSPKKQDKPPNPYVKLVDAARKKKLQKSKGQKKSKSKSTTKQTKQATDGQPRNVTSDKNECEDVEMMEVEALVHQDCEKNENSISNGDIQGQQDKNGLKTKETSKDSKNKKESPQKMTQKLEKSPKKSSPKGKQAKIISNNNKKSDSVKTIGKTICLDDSNDASDVKVPETLNSEGDMSKDKEQDSVDQSEKSDSKSPSNNKKRVSKRKPQHFTPKRSSRNQTKSLNETEAVKSEVVSKDSEDNQKEEEKDAKSASDKKDDTELSKEEENSDIEMIEPPNEQQKSPKENSQENPEISENEELKSKMEEPVTPKCNTRNRTKETDSNLDASMCSTHEESMTSNPSTPKHADRSLNESLKNLTPKQMAKRLEAAKKREEREKEKQEREKKRQEEKEERAKQRQEKEDQKKREREEKEEAKKKEREEKEEQRKKEREEKEKQKELEKKVREEKEEAKRKEKEEKEEQKRKEKEAREEERRKKQEALELEKQEQELKLKKTKEAFVSFFVPKQKVDKESSTSERAPVSKNSMLSSFTVKVDMRLAPTCRVELDVEKKEALVKLMQEQNASRNYLELLKDGKAKPGSCGKTWPLDEKDDDVMIVEDELPPIDVAGEVITCESAPREKLRPKLFSFHENRRPPYWGTWRKKSQFVKPRRPFGQEKQLDYEVDSDDDWEDDADGESLDGSAGGSDDEAGNDDYEVDNEVFVPHGYLSDEEATMDEEDDDVLSLSPETQKARLKHLEDEFESELKKPTEKLKPRLYGPLWETSEGKKPEKCIDALWNYFEKFSMILDDVTALLQPAPEPEKEAEKKKIKKKKAVVEGEGNKQSPKSKKKKEAKAENKEGKKPKQEVKKSLPNQPGINAFLKKVNTT